MIYYGSIKLLAIGAINSNIVVIAYLGYLLPELPNYNLVFCLNVISGHKKVNN